jgi:hypothetical protein
MTLRATAVREFVNVVPRVGAHARPTDTKRSHRSARLGWVTFWVTQKVPPC